MRRRVGQETTEGQEGGRGRRERGRREGGREGEGGGLRIQDLVATGGRVCVCAFTRRVLFVCVSSVCVSSGATESASSDPCSCGCSCCCSPPAPPAQPRDKPDERLGGLEIGAPGRRRREIGRAGDWGTGKEETRDWEGGRLGHREGGEGVAGGVGAAAAHFGVVAAPCLFVESTDCFPCQDLSGGDQTRFGLTWGLDADQL